MLEKGRLYTISELEGLGLTIYKELSAKVVIFKDEVNSFWFHSKIDHINRYKEYIFILKT